MAFSSPLGVQQMLAVLEVASRVVQLLLGLAHGSCEPERNLAHEDCIRDGVLPLRRDYATANVLCTRHEMKAVSIIGMHV